MTDQLDSFYDCVNARTYGSLGNDDDITEVMCNAFFESHNMPLHPQLQNAHGVRGFVSSTIQEAEKSITMSVHDALVSNQTSLNQNSEICATAASELPVGVNRAENPQTGRSEDEAVVIELANDGRQEAHEIVQDENRHEITSVLKTAEELENLGRLAMFGKQRAVLRRSQIREPSAALASVNETDNRSTLRIIPRRATTPTPTENSNPNEQQTDTATNVRSERSSRPGSDRVTPRVTPRITPLAQHRTPQQAPRTTVPVSANRTPILRAVRTNTATHSPLGPVTRARSRELGSRVANVNTIKANAAAKSQKSGTENIEYRLRQMRLGGEHISRNRAPRATTNSRSGLAHLQPVRIQQQKNPESFLRDEPIPSPREFRQELLHRNASLGSSERTSSTPKNDMKVASANLAGTTSKGPASSTARNATNSVQRPIIRSSSVTRPALVVNRPAPRASSVTRIPTTNATVVRPTARSSSITRTAVVRAPSVSHLNTQPATGLTRTQMQPAASTACQQRRPPSVNRPHVRPPSVTRPNIPNAGTKRRDIPRGGLLPTSARVPVGRGPVTIQGSARRTTTNRGTPIQRKPTEPRSSVIRNPPSNKGPGDSTPVREFRAELRRYPAPTIARQIKQFNTRLCGSLVERSMKKIGKTEKFEEIGDETKGLTPVHRPVTTTANVNFHPIHDHACTSNQNHVHPVVATVPTPTKVLSKREVTAMINRLYMPRKSAVLATPLKIASEQTHGLSCIRTRSRSTSMARRPLSAQDQMRPTSSRALDFAPEDHHRPASADQTENIAAVQEPPGESGARN